MSAQSEIGTTGDVVTLTLGGDTLTTYEDYQVATSILTQPAAFSMRLGTGDTVKTLISQYPPNTPFQLHVGPVLIQTGATDGFEASDGGGATQIEIQGRDALAPLHDGFVLAEKSFTNATYLDIVKAGFTAVGLDPSKIQADNEANRKAITNGKATSTSKPDPGAPKPINHPVYVHIGERWYEFIKRHLDRAGLFLWAGADGSFVITSPNAKQTPTYQITRQRGQTRDQVNVVRASFRNSTQPRFSNCVVYSRGGGKKYGAAKGNGAFVDDEMFNPPPGGYGYNTSRPLVIRDADAKDVASAEFHARRKLAEGARAGWHLTYTLAGHTAPALSGGMAPWACDTIVAVADDEYGITGNYWIESATFNRGAEGTTTTIVLMQTKNLIFGDDEA